MRRGFKKEATDLSRDVRAELGLTLFDALDPWQLAEHVDIPVWTLSSFSDLAPEAAGYLLQTDTGAFSAMLAFCGQRRVIVQNDAHAPTRQRADIAHELGHALLLHKPHQARAGEPPRFDHAQEEEAKWLGGVLLVTDAFCVRCARDSVDLRTAAAQMGVSTQLMRWRINLSGAEVRARRSRASRQASGLQ